MFNSRFFCIVVCALFVQVVFSQDENLIINDTLVSVKSEFFSINSELLDTSAPTKAAFYSAIFPGMGQAYNKKYWKIPFVYAALGTSTYAYIYNSKQYNRYRNAFKLEENGKPHEFDGTGENPFLSRDALMRAQTTLKENRDLSILITAGIYMLQIVEASVNAHLMQMNTFDDISFNPNLIIDPITHKVVGGVTVSFNF